MRAHLIREHLEQGHDLLEAVRLAAGRFVGAYALAVIDAENPDRIVATRIASPLVIGLGLGENFIASGVPALLPVTRRFIHLEQGDLAEIGRDAIRIFDSVGEAVERLVHETQWSSDSIDKEPYRHYMLKEIFEQPRAIADTLYGRVADDRVVTDSLGPRATELFEQVRNLHIVACGTAYHAGRVAKYWIESLAGLPCQVEIASEYRYRDIVVSEGTLFVAISQSGETADTLEALRMARQADYIGVLTICNSPQSSMVRKSDLVMMTQAGPEIGVASTKAFTTQLISLLLVTLMLARQRGMPEEREAELVTHLYRAAGAVEKALAMNGKLEDLAESFAEKQHALFLGRGPMWPVAMEGALKLKEISYIHAEGLRGGRTQARPARARRRGNAGRGRRAEQRTARQAQVQHEGRARSRRPALRLRRPRFGAQARTRRNSHRDALRGPPDRSHRLHGALAATRLPRGSGQGDGCRSAAQSREVGDGGVGGQRFRLYVISCHDRCNDHRAGLEFGTTKEGRAVVKTVTLPDWLDELRRLEVTDRVRDDPRSTGGTLLGMDMETAFAAISGGQADFDAAVGDLSSDDLALLYAYLNQKGHLEELVEAFGQLLDGTRPDNPIVVDVGCGPFTGGLALADALGDDPCFDYIGVDQAASMRQLGAHFASSKLVPGRIVCHWATDLGSVDWPHPPGVATCDCGHLIPVR